MYGIPRKAIEPRSRYDARFLNIGKPVDSLLRSLEAWKDDFRENERGLNLLFYGAPGTGKTAFGRYLADYLGLYPVVKRASDLLGPFVGMTERAIRDAFTEAEGAVLIIDEADSLLSERQAATHVWERSRTNEILTSMESFKGLFIASTNLRSVLDGASFRRFAFKVEFRGIAPEKLQDLMAAYFPGLSWSEEEQCVLESLGQVTLGDVAAVARRCEFSREITTALVLAELQEELSIRGTQDREDRVFAGAGGRLKIYSRLPSRESMAQFGLRVREIRSAPRSPEPVAMSFVLRRRDELYCHRL